MGVHSRTGRLFPGARDTRWKWDGDRFSLPIKAGDVMGCGVDMLQGRVFFTHNGALLGAAVPSARRPTVEALHNDVNFWVDLDHDGAIIPLIDNLIASRRRSREVGLAGYTSTFPAGTKIQACSL